MVIHRFANHWCVHLLDVGVYDTFGILVMAIKSLLSPILYLWGFTLNIFWRYLLLQSFVLGALIWALCSILKRLSALAIRIFLIVLFLAYDSSYIWMSVYSKSLYFDYISSCYWIVVVTIMKAICVNIQYSLALLLPIATSFLSW